MKNIRTLSLLLLLSVTGAQSAGANDWGPDWEYCTYYKDYTSNGISYYLYHTSSHKDDASLYAITATGDVVVPAKPYGARLFSIGYWPDHDQSEDVTVTSDMTSLTFNAHVNIHGTFTLENLHGPLTFYGPSNNALLPGCIRCTTVKMGSTLNIPRATALSIDCFQVDGTVNAPALTNVTFTPNTVINGTFNANNATSATLKGTIAGTVNLAKVTLPIFRWNGGDCKITGSGHVNVPVATNIHLESGYGVSGEIYAPSATEVNLDWGSHFANYGSIYAPAATAINIESGDAMPTEFYGKITSNQLTSISLGYVDFGSTGKLDCSKLTDIYIPSRFRIPIFDGAYSNHFTVPSKTITVHVYDMSPKELTALKNSSATWSGFNIVNHQSDISYTLISDGHANATLYDLNNSEDFAQATNVNQIAQVTGGSRSGTIKAGHNYAVVIKDVDWDNRKVTLNGSIDLTSHQDQGMLVKYRNYPDLRMGSRFEVCVSDKTCDLQISQQRQCVDTIGHYNEEWNFHYTTYADRYGKINYTKYLDGTTTNGSFQSKTATITGSQGSMVTLSIPYDEYCPDNLMVDGTLVPFEMSEGVATASFRLPSSTEQITTCNASLKWKKAPEITVVEPVPEGVEVGDTIVVRGDTIVVDGPTMVVPARHQPQMMVMRSGDGDVLLKGMCNPDIYGNESWAEQIRDAYEQEFGYPADEYGIVVNAVANCVSPVTTLTVPNIDYLGQGGEFDATDWGFQAEITPVTGQTLKTLLVGWITEEDDRQVIKWEDMLHGVFSNYVKYNEATNTYIFNWGFDEMNVWIGDYIINIGMGPEETSIETGATLNFVRKGGRTEVLFESEDPQVTNYDQPIEEGSTSYKLGYFTQAEQDEAGMDCYQLLLFNPVEGETIHVLCDATDISDKITYRDDGSAFLNLERKNHTYSIYIDDAPDANPTWTILQGEGMTGSQVVVKRNGEDETTTLDLPANTMTIDDVGVEKVTLKVPLGPVEQVVQYKVMLDAVENQNAVRIYLVGTLGLGRFAVSDLFNSLPALIPIDAFDTEEEAQAVVEAIASKGGTAHTVSGYYGATQPVPGNLPIRVLRNGAEFTTQMTFGDPLYATCEVPFATLTDATWEVSFDTSRRQIFYRKGGSLTSDIQYEIYYNEPIVEIPKDSVTIVDLPAYGEPNGNLQLNIQVADDEKLTVYRNNIDITEKFDYDEENGYRNYFHNGGNVTDAYSIENWGFNTREAATWVIDIKSFAEQVKTTTIANPDGMEIVYARYYTDGIHLEENITEEYHTYQFDDSDRANTRFILLMVPMDENRPVRVLRDGVDVTYSGSDEWIAGDYVSYVGSLTDNNTWDITYDNSHKQTFVIKGGLYPEVNFEYRASDITQGLQVDGVTEVYLPDYNYDWDNTSADFTIGAKPNETFKAFRNGVEVPEDMFTKVIVSENLRRYTLNFDDAEIATALGVDLRDPATWVIIVDDGSGQYDVNGDGEINVTDVTALVNKILHP